MNIYALDIETDNSEGHGLDPRRARITSVAVKGSNGAEFYASASDDREENALLFLLNEFLSHQEPGEVVTWNGSNFDVPFLAHRAERHHLYVVDVSISHDRPAKYPKGPDDFRLFEWHDGGYLAAFTGHNHADIAYAYKDMAEEAGIKWSLKPVAEYLGIDAFVLDSTRLHDFTDEERRQYNISDAAITLELAQRLEELPLDWSTKKKAADTGA